MSDETTRSVSFLSDLPADRDILDYKAYRDALLSIINSLTVETSLTIAVFGEWGSGKTTLLKMIEDELRINKTQTIWVNVWQFGSEEDVWTAFLQSLLLKIKKEIPFFRRFMFNIGLFRRRINWEKVNKKIPELVIRLIIVVTPIFISLWYLKNSDQSGSAKVTAGAGTLLGTIFGWFLLLQPYLKAVKERVSVDLTGLVKSSQLRERVSLLDQFKTYFEDMVVSLVGENGRAIIFIDDLDRCQPDRIVQVLDAIKLFLDIPRCIYLVGLDREIVEQAIKVKFEKYKHPESEAREYLEKIIGLPFDLPPLSGPQMEVLVRGLETNLPDAPRSTQVFALGQEPNPRKVKRTINMFLLLWVLAQGRKELGEVIKPTRLAKIVVLQHSYRDLFIILTLFPRYLGELEAYFREHEKAEEIAADGKSNSGTPPDHLKPFVANESLRRLLTLHPFQAQKDEDANFTIWRDGKCSPISEEEVRAYIRLTRSITTDQKKTRSPRSGPIFIDRQAELSAFVRMLDDSSQKHILLITGPGGIGKSALLARYSEECSERGIPFANVQLSTLLQADSIHLMKVIRDAFPQGDFSHFDNAVYSQGVSIGKIVSALQDGLARTGQNNKIVIFLDDYDVTPDPLKNWIGYEFLPSIVSVPNIIMCVVGRDVPSLSGSLVSARTTELSLRPFAKEDIANYLKALNVQLTGEAVEVLQRISEGNPAKFAQAAEMLNESHAD